jgi:fibronectin type 3 domain-containing protein
MTRNTCRAGKKLPVLAVLLALVALAGVHSAGVYPRPPRDVPAAPGDTGGLISGLEEKIESLEARGLEADHLEAYLFWLKQRAYPNNDVDWSAYARAYAHRSRMRPALLGRARQIKAISPANASAPSGTAVFGGNWEFLGPTNLPVPYQTYYGEGTTSGRVNDAAFVPGQAGTYYIATAGGGLWKTTDSGQNWTPLSNSWTSTFTSSVAVDPTNPSTVYCGTGDFDDGTNAYGFGVMKSTDGGASWTNLGATQFSRHAIRRIVVDPENPSIVLLTTGRNPSSFGNVWRSVDGGANWTAVVGSAWFSDLAYGALSGGNRYLYACGERNGGAVWRSADRGVTWTQLAPPLGGSTVWHYGLDLATSPTSPNTVYLLCGQVQKVLKSTDAGANWTDVSVGFPNGNATQGATYNWSQYTYDDHITCSTRADTGSDVVYVGLIDVVASPDGGGTWQSVGQTYTDGALTHNDQHCMAIDPANPNQALVGNDGGVYGLTFTPSTGTWTFDTSLNKRVGVTQFYHAAFHPTDPTIMMGGAQDNATPISTGDLANWGNTAGGDGGFSAINSANPEIQYGTVQNLVIYRTGDRWTNLTDASPSLGTDRKAFIAPITLDPNNPNLLYAGTNYLWRRDDTTSGWTSHLGSQELATPGGKGYVTYIAVAPGDSNRIYTGSSDGNVWMTTDAGGTWTQINTGTTSLPNRWITSIAVHPTNPSSILVGVSGTGTGHLWRCADTLAGGSRTWTDVSSGASGLPDIPLNTVAIDPRYPDQAYYAGTDVGLFVTTDSGGTWANATTPLGLPNVQVNDLQVVPGTNYLMAATYGRGMWRIPFLPPGELQFGASAYSVSETAGTTTITVTRTTSSSGAASVNYATSDGSATALSDYTAASGTLNFADGETSKTFSISVTNDALLEGAETVNLTLSAASGAALGTPSTAVLTLADNTAAPAPTGLAGTAGSGGVALTWADHCDNELDFRIERKTSSGAYAELPATAPANATSYTDATADPSTIYTYRIRAAKGTLFSDYSNEVTVSPGPPAAPVLTDAVGTTATQVRLTWTDQSNNETRFRVERKLGTGAFTEVASLAANTTSYLDGGLSPNTSYVYQVRASSSFGYSAYSVQKTGRTLIVPVAPSALGATAFTPTQVMLTWHDNSSSETGFKVERQKPDASWQEIGVARPDTPSYLDSGLTTGNTYTYRVRAVSGTYLTAYTSEASVTLLPAPSAPTNLAGGPVSATQVRLTWGSDGTNVTGFRLERKVTGQAYAEVQKLAASARECLDSPLTPNTTYAYRLRAVNQTVFSSYSGQVSATTWATPATPTNLAAARYSSTQIKLTWTDASTTETQYRVERQKADLSWEEIKVLAANSTLYIDSGRTAGTANTYRVRAVSGTASSGYSNTATATP